MHCEGLVGIGGLLTNRSKMIRFIFTFVTIVVVLFPKHVTYARLSKLRNSKHHTNGVRLNFTSLAAKYGHPSIQYDVITEDGYILELFRLPGKSRFPVLLVHGLLDSADAWILRGQDSLAVTLANKDYDVWCANTRGNRYSRRHVFLNPDTDAIFWRFSFDEVGYYDLSAIIDNILEKTSAPSLSAIGHSQGTTVLFALGATRPEYNKKINVMLALAPEAYIHHCPPPVSTFIKIAPLIENVLKALQINEVLGDTRPGSKLLQLVCPLPIIGYEVCVIGFIFPITGFDSTELEPSFYSITAKNFPAGTSSRSIVHYLQLGYRNTFAKFDNGPDFNLALYNSTTPPPYDLSRISMPIALFTAENDHLSTLPDVALLRKQLPNVVYNLVNPRKEFNHIDYTVGKNMRSYLFPYIFEVLQRYNTIEKKTKSRKSSV